MADGRAACVQDSTSTWSCSHPFLLLCEQHRACANSRHGWQTLVGIAISGLKWRWWGRRLNRDWLKVPFLLLMWMFITEWAQSYNLQYIWFINSATVRGDSVLVQITSKGLFGFQRGYSCKLWAEHLCFHRYSGGKPLHAWSLFLFKSCL